jgi:hypothetical protein
MRDEGLLIRKRGGPGQTATQWFAIKGKMLFDTAAENTIERGQVVDFPMRRRRIGKSQDRQDSAGLERQDSAGLERQDSACLDRQDSANKPFEQHPFEQHPIEPPLSPKSQNATAELATGSDDGVLPDHHACGETARSLARKEVETVLNGEIVGPVTFSDFWNGSRRRSDNKDKPGPARKAFEMLSTEERQEITALLDRDGEIDLGGEWSCIWLRTRAWREAQLRKSGIAGVFEALRPRPGSREDRQEMTANSRRQFREWAWREDSATGDNNTLVAAQLGYGIASCPPGQYPIIEHTRAFEEWCQHYRRNRRVPPLAIDIVDQHGKRSRGFYKPTPYPPDDDDDGVSV